MAKNVECADLFCGAGGCTSAMLEAAGAAGIQLKLHSINHWKLAIETLQSNHPNVLAYNSDLERIDPRQIVSTGKLRLLWASPECTYFSTALGGKPINPQSRATPKWVIKWLTCLDVQDVLIENVPEFRSWGPIHRCSCGKPNGEHLKGSNCFRPIQSRKGQFFRAFIKKIQELGYTVEHRILNAADYGDATSRKRLFIACRKGDKKFSWPEPTHHKNGGDLRGEFKKWVPAREIIDFSIPGKSIFFREKPLSPKTMKRIEIGLRRYCGIDLMMSNQSGARAIPLDLPVPTITANGSISLFQPFITTMDQGGGVHSSAIPLHTITSADATAIVQPFAVEYHGTGGAHSIEEPFPTITNNDCYALAEPFLVEMFGTSTVRSVNLPVSGITGNIHHHLALPVIIISGKKYYLDVLYRMFEPHEYAAAMGFRKNYFFAGTRKAKVKQIGNAVPHKVARALCYSMYST